ncbi:SBBP repeat-containing protein, partial [Leptospira santarosai]
MIRFYFFLFIFIQACSPIGGLLNVNGSDSKANDYRWMVFLQGDNNLSAPIENSIPSNEDIAEENVLYENADVPWTLLVGAPNTSTGGAGLAIDSNGFIYVVGDTTAGIYSENLIGTKDMILAKYNSRKQIIWSKQIGIRGVHLDAADVGVDARGNVYVVASNSIGLGNKSLFAFKFDTNGREI